VANPTITEYLKALHAREGAMHSQVASVAYEIPDYSKRFRKTVPGTTKRTAAPEETLAFHFPGGIGKRAVTKMVLGADYSSTVNVQRMAEGLAPNFTPAPLWKGAGAVHPELPGEMSYHTGTGHQVIKYLPLEQGGKTVTDWEEYYHSETGKPLTAEELAVAGRFMRAPGKNKRQGASFDEQGNVTIPGELEDKVPWRTLGAENIKAIATEAEIQAGGQFTSVNPERYVSPAIMASAAHSAPEPEPAPTEPPADGGGRQPPSEPPAAGSGPEPEPDPESGSQQASSEPPTAGTAAEGLDVGSIPWGEPPGEPPEDPEAGDKNVRWGNAAFASQQLGRTFGTIIGGAFGPGGAAAGSVLGGLFGKTVGGGEVTSRDIAGGVIGAAGGAIGGPAGAVLKTVGGLLGGMGGGNGNGNGNGNGTGGGGSNDVIGLLTKIEMHLRTIANDGIFIRGDHRRAGGSVI
jgi:hypothetical protein